MLRTYTRYPPCRSGGADKGRLDLAITRQAFIEQAGSDFQYPKSRLSD